MRTRQLVALAMIGSLLCACGSAQRGAEKRPAPPASAAHAPVSWLAYMTAVDPGSSIDFVTGEVGWRLTGQESGIDNHLSAGPGGSQIQPVGSGVEATADGGRTWATIRRVPTGVWGIDLLSASVGFVVGVTTLQRTDDGGEQWTSLAEPAGRHLVWVHFDSIVHGVGLTINGTMVVTRDGGRSWKTALTPGRATAACFSSSRSGYITDGAGDLLATRDGGRSWTIVKRGPGRIEQYFGPWADISCSGPKVMVGLQYLCGAACAASNPYLVERSADGGRTWVGPKPSPGGLPGAENAVFGAVGTDAEMSVLAALPDENSETVAEQRDVTLLVSDGGRYRRAAEPPLPGPHSEMPAVYRAQILGVALHGKTGWLDFATQPPSPARSEPIVWRTTDAGRTWTQLSPRSR